MTVVCRDSRTSPPLTGASTDDRVLRLEVGEQVILIAKRSEHEWFGQRTRTRKFGLFHRSAVNVQSHRTPSRVEQTSSVQKSVHSAMSSNLATLSSAYRTNQGREISFPIPGSLIHTGHGDTDENRSWGRVDKIDEVYLKNPIVSAGVSYDNKSEGVSFIPTLKELHTKGGTMKMMGETKKVTDPYELDDKAFSFNQRTNHRRASAEELGRIFEQSFSLIPSIPAPPAQTKSRPVSSQHPGTLPVACHSTGSLVSARDLTPPSLPTNYPITSAQLPSLGDLQRQKQAFCWLDEELKTKGNCVKSSNECN